MVELKKKNSKKTKKSLPEILRDFSCNVDISETELLKLFESKDGSALEILLQDRTTGKHILWATDNYKEKYHYLPSREIETKQITDSDIVGNGRVIIPRALKTKAEQLLRTKQKAEVFTPSWVCNAQNNLVDEAWFEWNKEEHDGWSIFNRENEDHTWETNPNKIVFPEGKTWMDYVNDERLEMTCGEAPYLVSRYDTTTGIALRLDQRVGLLDRKFRVIKENFVPDANKSTEDIIGKWRDWAFKALKATYGFEWQGDSLLLARENIFVSFVEYFYDYCQTYNLATELTTPSLITACKIISWNIWQMDGIHYIIPYSDRPMEESLAPIGEIPFAKEPSAPTSFNKEGILANIAMWTSRGNADSPQTITFKSLTEKKQSNI